MLTATKRNITFIVFALAATLMLMAAPIAPAYADCQGTSQSQCSG